MSKLVEFQDVALGYGRKTVLNSLSFTINKGESVGIAGPNGAGKSTLLKALLGLIKPISGRIIYHSDDLRFGYVPQRQVMDEIYPLTALDIVKMGRYGLLGPFKRPGRRDHATAMECLEHAGIAHLASKPFREMSGGQKQRVLIARSLASDPTVLVLDEPTTDMDVAAERSIMDLVRHLQDDRSLTIILVSHALGVVANYSSKMAFVGNGVFHIGEMQSTLTAENLSRLYSTSVQVVQIDGRHVIM